MDGSESTASRDEKSEHKKQIAENLRFHVDMRFKQLTLFVAFLSISAAGIGAYGDKFLFRGAKVSEVISLAGIVFTTVFLTMEVRSHLYWKMHHAEAPELWPSPKNPFLRYVNSTYAVAFLYLAIQLFWSYAAHKIFHSCFVSLMTLMVFVFSFVYSTVNYWRVRE